VHDFDDLASISIEYESGATGLLTTASISPANWREFVFLFARGLARLDSPHTYLDYGPAENHMTRLEPKDLPPANAVATGGPAEVSR
jgi:hypothetical protein